jgi:hypothetical protein
VKKVSEGTWMPLRAGPFDELEIPDSFEGMVGVLLNQTSRWFGVGG